MVAASVDSRSIAASPRANDDLRTAKRAGKDHFTQDDATTLSGSELAREAALTALTAEEEKRLLRKVDWRLIPLLAMLYLVKKLDEINVRFHKAPTA
jgi:hypothetical protein